MVALAGSGSVTPEEVLAELTRMIKDVVGADYAESIEVELVTSFQEDLELESIEFVELSELLNATYGDRVDFAGWMASLDLAQILGMTVGQVVDFVVESLQSRAG